MPSATPTKRPRATKTIDSVVGLRPRHDGAIYKLAPGTGSLVQDTIQTSKPFIDRAKMSVRAIISTPVVDRYGDTLNPMGCELKNYALNPVVLWGHGFGFDKPIARSEDENGNLTVMPGEQFVSATSYFSQSLPEAVQIFELIDEGIVRGTSVRETPIVSSWVRQPDGNEILVVDQWDLEEWSWCAVGVNPECVAKAQDVIGRNKRFDGRRLHPSIAKSLIAICPEVKKLGIGFVEEKQNVTTAAKKTSTKAAPPCDPNKMCDPAEKADPSMDLESPTEQLMDPNESIEDSVTEPTDSNSDPTMSPLGQTVLTAMYNGLSELARQCNAAMGPLENPAVKEGLTSIMNAIGEQQAAVEGLYSSTYPSAPALKADPAATDGNGSGDQASEMSLAKAFLARSTNAQYQVQGLASRLKTIAGEKNVTREQKSLLSDVSARLVKLAADSKSHAKSLTQSKQSDPSESARIALLKQIEDLKTSLTKN